jgi:hypothetical protein
MIDNDECGAVSGLRIGKGNQYQPQMIDNDECGAVSGLRIGKGN